MDTEGTRHGYSGAQILHIKSEESDMIQHNKLPISKYLGIIDPNSTKVDQNKFVDSKSESGVLVKSPATRGAELGIKLMRTA